MLLFTVKYFIYIAILNSIFTSINIVLINVTTKDIYKKENNVLNAKIVIMPQKNPKVFKFQYVNQDLHINVKKTDKRSTSIDGIQNQMMVNFSTHISNSYFNHLQSEIVVIYQDAKLSGAVNNVSSTS